MTNCFGRIVRHGIGTLLEHCAEAQGRAAAEEGTLWAAAAN